MRQDARHFVTGGGRCDQSVMFMIARRLARQAARCDRPSGSGFPTRIVCLVLALPLGGDGLLDVEQCEGGGQDAEQDPQRGLGQAWL
jgi:hypothetical protein